jgi:subtilisin family serine protease
VKRIVPGLAAALTLVGVGLGTTAPPAQASQSSGTAETAKVYLVVLRQAPVASYQGGIASYAATAPAAGQHFDDSAATVVAYRSYLLARQGSLLDRLGNPAELYSYTTALNGFAAMLTASQVKTLQTTADVLLVQPDTRVGLDGSAGRASTGSGPATAGTAASLSAGTASRLWSQVGGPENAGRGVVIGVIDSGVWPENPSLAGIPISAQTRGNTYPGFRGICQAGSRWTPATCNSKVIAARYFVRGFGRRDVAQSDYLSPRDWSGHGTSVSAIAAGNAGVDTRIGGQDFGHISGLAPAAALSIYKACWSAPDPSRDGCDTADAVKAIDQAVQDGVDVINYSIGGATSTLADPVQLAFLNAAAANVFVAAPAGNGGPSAGTTQHLGPWVTTVGANTEDVFRGGVRLGDGRTFIGAMLSDKRVGPAPLVYARDVAAGGVSPQRSALCYPGSLAAQRVDGAIVVCDRGVTSRVSKSAAVARAGGHAMVLVNTSPGSVDADLHRVPTVHLDAAAGSQVTSYLAQAEGAAVATILPGATDNPPVPVVADFSGRGPADAAGGDVLKPDLTAPGVSVVSAVAPTAGSDQLWDVQSGTSIATPHVAGVAAVVRSAHPSWTPAETRSAMMTTARPLHGVTSPLTRGAGELDSPSVLEPGLVYDTGIAEWSELLREQGIDVAGLGTGSAAIAASDVNAPSIAVGDLVARQTVTRTVTNVGTTTDRYAATVTGLRGVASSVTPDTVTLRPGRSATFTIAFSATKNARYDVFASGSLTWRSSSGRAVVSPVVVRPELASIPTEVAGSGRTGSATIEALAGVTGTIHVATAGLVGATPVPLSLRAGLFDPEHPVTSAATAMETLGVPGGSRAARFEVTARDPGDDVDLYVYRGETLIASATGGSGNETVTMSRPPAGGYRVYVTAHHAGDGATARATFTSWVLPHARQDNLQIERRYIGVNGGETFSAVARWAGLDPRQRWWGYVAYRGMPGVTYLTVN